MNDQHSVECCFVPDHGNCGPVGEEEEAVGHLETLYAGSEVDIVVGILQAAAVLAGSASVVVGEEEAAGHTGSGTVQNFPVADERHTG
jgi:hypothetical protein|mmetsp:Transcript_28915/g.52923  ORF Transcript_28915/g.52923 Transcript_28915/m.52923 type:complete len:88 (+) Transcript_28915:157-420(+)